MPYLADLGVDAVWFSPFFASPQRDIGYDVSDYRSVAPEYGTLDDAQRLIDRCHELGLKVVFDLVLNHTSDEHPWFVESRSSRDNPKADWYVWADGGTDRRGRPTPPNNWRSELRPAASVAVGRGTAAVVPGHVPRLPARPQLAQPRGRGRA